MIQQDYSKLHHVEVIVKASLHVESTTKNTVLENKDTEVIHVVFFKILDYINRETFNSHSDPESLILMFCHCDRARQVKLTVYPERREAQYGGVPWWIIVLSILFGLMLLALLAFLLWKVGQQTGNTPCLS